MPISMVRYALATGVRMGTTFFFVVGVVSSIGSLNKKVQSLSFGSLVSSIPTLADRPISLSLFSSSFQRPYVDVVVFCITFVLIIGQGRRHRHRHRHAPKEQSQSAEKPLYKPKHHSPPLLTYHDSREASELCLQPESSPSFGKNPAIPPVEDGLPPEKKRSKETPTRPSVIPNGSLVGSTSPQFLRSLNGKKSANQAEVSDHPPVKRSPTQLRHSGATKAAENSGQLPPERSSPQLRHLPNKQKPAESVASSSQRAPGGATWTLERQPALIPSTWKPFPDDQLFLLDEEAEFFHREHSTTAYPAASAPPWPGSTEEDDDEAEAHNSMDETWREITAARLLKKSETFATSHRHMPEPTVGEDRMKKSETFNESSSFLRRERSMSAEELRRRAEEFISKTRNDLRLQREESVKRYKEMINLGSL